MADVDGYFFSVSDGYFSDKYFHIDGYFFTVSDGYLSENYFSSDGKFNFIDGYYSKKSKDNPGEIFIPLEPINLKIHYRMRAWNTVTLNYEIWTSIGYPDPNPPSGDPVIGVSIISISEV